MDTGPLVALGDAADHRHIAASELLRANAGSLVIPILVAAEVAYLLAKRLGVHAEAAFLSDIAQGAFKGEPVNHDDWSRILYEIQW